MYHKFEQGRKAVRAAILTAVRQGATLKAACQQAGCHYSSLHRWRGQDDHFYSQLLDAIDDRDCARPDPPRYVPVRRLCPRCRSELTVRPGRYGWLRFTCCPECRWASWRLPAPWDC